MINAQENADTGQTKRPPKLLLHVWSFMDRVDGGMDRMVSHAPVPFTRLKQAEWTYIITGLIAILVLTTTTDLLAPALYKLGSQPLYSIPGLETSEGGVLGIGTASGGLGILFSLLGYAIYVFAFKRRYPALSAITVVLPTGLVLALVVSIFTIANIYSASMGYPFIGPVWIPGMFIGAVCASALLCCSGWLTWTSLVLVLGYSLISSFFGVSDNRVLVLFFAFSLIVFMEIGQTLSRFEFLKKDEMIRIRAHGDNLKDFVKNEKRFRKRIGMTPADLPKVEEGPAVVRDDPWVISLILVLYKGHFRAFLRSLILIGGLMAVLPLLYLGWLYLLNTLPYWTGGPIISESLLSTTPFGPLLPLTILAVVLYAIKKARYVPEPEEE